MKCKVTNLDNYPLFLSVGDIAEIIPICKRKAYALCKSEGFPCKIEGKKYIISKAAFEKWMEDYYKTNVQA